ncbi:hypothetical protein NPF39_001044 [Salmonella enterica subsp. enterica serovar Uganda]|nr:hypothetical protein [Salmonella enterica subsp. enterica serovar Uganda]EIL2947315.1 hypothetical protein [Salmonella enterica subsp. enterica serovar Uganda]EIX2952290.1 hypothetical protein [Salmonella enterica subsp. enterica serovar Uganda]EJN2431610.1 hypothetical protein [Salmonella enterica subsp. enterica serovar Uganda]HEH9008952.1 hypothetical protein [Salmonella enterica]
MVTPVLKILPAYPFVQYRDDENVVAFFEAYNELAQQYLDSLNNLNLPCWTSPSITGELLDWIAKGIYGEERPVVMIAKEAIAKGAYNSIEYNALAYARLRRYVPGITEYLPDDYFKRILTWNFFKGDGFHFSLEWLKRRVARFIHGVAGIDPPIQHTFDVSITVDNGTFSIVIPEYGNGVGNFLKAAIDQQLVKLPFIYHYTTTVEEQ